MSQYLLAIDQGTSSSRAIVFTHTGVPMGQCQIDLSLYYPKEGWVEQDPEEMWTNILQCIHQVLSDLRLKAKDIAVVGITNQRETTIIWDKNTGQPIYRAIVWQDRRTSEICKQLEQHPINISLKEKTGLLLDPYFSASKILWLLNNIPNAREQAERGELLFGTVDTFLLWRLTKGKVHATDATNASRTLLFNIQTQQWDDEILHAFNIPATLLPTVLDSSADFGVIDKEYFNHSIPIGSMIGDQQAATVGQACFERGMVKSTYGTGGFLFLNTGEKTVSSTHKLLSTVAYRIKGKVTYGLEGSIFSAGATIKWLRDKLQLIKTASETSELAQSIHDTGGVYLIPGFTGLGAPYWDSNARGALLGLTSNSGVEQIVRAALESVAYQTRDLLTAMASDMQEQVTTLRVDGGMTANTWLLQFLADILNLEIQKPACIETTALGAAYLAGLQIGTYHSLSDISNLWQANQSFFPQMLSDQRQRLCHGWEQAIAKVVNKME